MKIFDGLGYPYPIRPSYFNPTGAAHSWPYLLAALCWITDVIKVMHIGR